MKLTSERMVWNLGLLSTNHDIADSLLIRQSGSIIGPVIGGFFSDPVARYPSKLLMGLDGLFKAFPWALPNIIVCTVLLPGLLGAIFLLKVMKISRMTMFSLLNVFRKHSRTKSLAKIFKQITSTRNMCWGI